MALAALGVAAPAAQASLSVPSTPYTTLTAFETAVGGSDNGTTPGERGSGFRHWTPAGIAVNGSDPGATAIPRGHTAALASTRLQPWGIELGPAVAVADDGFASVNTNAGFSPSQLWAPFNSITTTLDVVAPTPSTSPSASAMTRGLGVEFVHVENSGTTISYYSGEGLIGQVTAPQGATSFAGMRFRDPIVTRVVITLGTAEIFDFDGSSLTSGGTDPTTLAAGDDVVLAEPGAGVPTTTATAGVPVSPTLENFDSNDAAADIRATVDWGDGSRSSAAIVPAGGGSFAVSASHGYAMPGSYTATVTVQDSGGSELTTQSLIQVAPRGTVTSVACSPTDVAVSATTTCTATVQDTGAGSAVAPTGLVTFSSPTPGASFPGTGSCVLGASAHELRLLRSAAHAGPAAAGSGTDHRLLRGRWPAHGEQLGRGGCRASPAVHAQGAGAAVARRRLRRAGDLRRAERRPDRGQGAGGSQGPTHRVRAPVWLAEDGGDGGAADRARDQARTWSPAGAADRAAPPPARRR